MKNRKKYVSVIDKVRQKLDTQTVREFIDKLGFVLSAIFTTFLPIICIILIMVVMLYKYFTN